jgi:hypothetical protein
MRLHLCSTPLTARHKLTSFSLCCLLSCAFEFHISAVLQTVAQECGISAMPTFQVFQDGAKVDEMVGASKDKLAALVEKWGKA